MEFIFELGDTVILVGDAVSGTVIGRVEYVDEEPCYYVKCDGNDGSKSRYWFAQSLLNKGF